MPVVADAQAPTPPAAQAPAAPAAAPTGAPTVESLKVVPLAGNNEVNDIQRKLMAPLVVEVLDQNDRPLENAEVIFRFPIKGASAMFPGGKTSQTTRTNGQGQAAAMNWVANSETGTFDVHVSASYGNQVGETTIKMSNANQVVQANGDRAIREKHEHWYSPTWVKIALAAGAAGVITGIVLGTTGGSSSGSSRTITISPGNPTVGH